MRRYWQNRSEASDKGPSDRLFGAESSPQLFHTQDFGTVWGVIV